MRMKMLLMLALCVASVFSTPAAEMREGFAQAFAERGSTLTDWDKAYLQKVRAGVIGKPSPSTLVDMVFCIEQANINMKEIKEATFNDQLAVYYYLGGEHGLPLAVIQRHWGSYRDSSPNTAKSLMHSRCPALPS